MLSLTPDCSAAPLQVGEHTIHVIDHIFWRGAALGRHEHVWGPLTFATLPESHACLLPSLQCPSDHLPVVVEFELRAEGERSPLGRLVQRCLELLLERGRACVPPPPPPRENEPR